MTETDNPRCDEDGCWNIDGDGHCRLGECLYPQGPRIDSEADE